MEAGAREVGPQRAFWWPVGILGTFGLLGSLGVRYAESLSITMPRPGNNNAFFYLYQKNETGFVAIFVLFALAVAAAPRMHSFELLDRLPRWRLSRRTTTWMAALAVLVVTRIGTTVVIHDYPLSMDEFGARFQATIFAEGKVHGVVPEEWSRYGAAMTPIFVRWNADSHTWTSGYLPAYAAILSVFMKLGLGAWLNPVLAALTVLAIASVTRRLFPEDEVPTFLAVAFLASSSQFVITSMTSYSMPAHLCLNTIWLALFLRNGVPRLLCPWVGVVALLLHNPFPHALFVAPFLVRMVWSRRWGSTLYFAVVYGLGCAAGLAWYRIAHFLESDGGGGLLSVFGAPRRWIDLATQGMNLAVIPSWQTPALGALAVLALLAWKQRRAIERDLAYGLLLTFLFYLLFFPSSQGHGWGYRYLYGVLSNLVLLGVFGYRSLVDLVGEAKSRGMLVATLAVSLLFQLPVRAVEAEDFVRRWAAAWECVQSFRGQVVEVDPIFGWYAQDLVRNDPFLRNDPKVVYVTRLSKESKRELEEHYAGHVHQLAPQDLLPTGVPTFFVVRSAPQAPLGPLR